MYLETMNPLVPYYIAYGSLLFAAIHFSWKWGEKQGVGKGINYTIHSLESAEVIFVQDLTDGRGKIRGTSPDKSIVIK